MSELAQRLIYLIATADSQFAKNTRAAALELLKKEMKNNANTKR